MCLWTAELTPILLYRPACRKLMKGMECGIKTMYILQNEEGAKPKLFVKLKFIHA